MKSFNIRLLASTVIVILTLITLIIGGPFCCAVLCAVSLKGVQELLRIYELHKSPIGFTAYVATVIYYAILMFDQKQLILPMITVYLLIILAIYVLRFPKYKDNDAFHVFIAFFYVSFMLSYLYQVRVMGEFGLLFTGLVFMSSWGNDMSAYAVGIVIGKHKMVPKLSPKKSIEGFFGGLLGAALFGILYAYLYLKYVDPTMQYAYIVYPVIGAIGAIPAVIGDLAASAIKRNHDVKDYGHLIPGHGGILDRFDSIIFTAPIVYYLLLLFSNITIQ